MSSTADPVVRSCRMCGKPEHGSLACSIAPPWPVRTQPLLLGPPATVIPLGWQCPVCKTIWSPSTWNCNTCRVDENQRAAQSQDTSSR